MKLYYSAKHYLVGQKLPKKVWGTNGPPGNWCNYLDVGDVRVTTVTQTSKISRKYVIFAIIEKNWIFYIFFFFLRKWQFFSFSQCVFYCLTCLYEQWNVQMLEYSVFMQFSRSTKKGKHHILKCCKCFKSCVFFWVWPLKNQNIRNE